MSSNYRSEKIELEKHATIEFCKAYNHKFCDKLTFIETCKPPFPDIRCKLNNYPLYLEIAHLYGMESDAKRLLDRKGKSIPSQDEILKTSLTPLRTRILGCLNEILYKKSPKNYNGDLIWLVVRNTNPLWSFSDFKSNFTKIQIPEKHPFNKIWLLCGPRAEDDIIELTQAI